VRLTSVDDADSPLGDGVALIFGTSGTQVAGSGYQQAVEQYYLEPRGFDGTVQAPFTPEGLYPVTGVHTLPVDTSFAQEVQILDSLVQGQMAGGGVDAANPIVVFGWSQSADFSGLTMPELAAQGVPSDDLHFILVGDASNPDGGLLERFDLPVGSEPSVPSLGITFDGATPSDFFPTDIYTNEYDGFADFPKYPIDFLSDVNAFLGILFDHITYLNPEPGQLADAIQLPTSVADTMTNYYMVPEDLPLTDLLRFIPVIGNPLADLLQPDLSVLVNYGYGSIADGWSPGDADIPSPMGLFPTDLSLSDVFAALVKGIPEGIGAAVKDLQDPANCQVISSILDNPLTNQLIDIGHTMGFTDATDLQQLLSIPALLGVAQTALTDFANFPISTANLLSSPTDLLNDLSATVSADYATLVPVADTVNALLTSLPSYDVSLFTDQLEAGNVLAAVGEPIAADLALIPFAFGYGAAAPVLEAVAGTLINVVDLIPGL
jgi:hypothetical protein